MLQRYLLLLFALFTWTTCAVPASGQDLTAMGEQRLADAKMFIADGEYDAALVALEEAGWYFPEGDERLSQVAGIKNQANAGKARARADQAMGNGDYQTAVRKYEESLRLYEDAATRTKLGEARARRDAAAAVEPATGTPDGPEPPTPEPPTEEPPTPDEPETPEEAETPTEEADADDDSAVEAVAEPPTPEPPTEEPSTAKGPDEDGAADLDLTPAEAGGGGATRGAGKKTPWGWLLALLGVVALGVVGTRTPVVSALAGTLASAGSHQAALSLYGVVEQRGGAGPAVRHAQVDCLLALDRFDDEAQAIYHRAIGDDLPPDVTVRLAKLYAQREIRGDEAGRLYELATRHEDDPALWEALEACTPAGDPRRLEIAQKLIALDRPAPERLLLVAEQYEEGEPDGALRKGLAQALQMEGDEEMRRRRAALADRLLPAYQEHDLKGPDAVALREAYLSSIDRREPWAGRGHRMVGPRAHRARVILADLSRLLWEEEQGGRLFEIHCTLLRRFRGEGFLLDGLLQVAADCESYDEALATIEELYPDDREKTDAALSVQVAVAFLMAARRNLRMRADQVGSDSGEFPGLTFLALARQRLASLGSDDGHRPDVREQLDVFQGLYQSDAEHLLPLDADLAELLWTVGHYPGAAALYLWNCGLEPHPVDGGLLVVPSEEERPPFSELFPEEMSTLVEIIGDRAIHREDVEKLAFRARSGVMNPYLTFLVGVAPFPDEVRRAASEQGPPVVLLSWQEIHAALDSGHPRETLRRVIVDRTPYPLAPVRATDELEDERLFGRGELRDTLRRRFLEEEPGRVLVLSGVRGVGKSTTINGLRRSPATPAGGLLVPRAEPELYVPTTWITMLGSLYENARHKGQMPPASPFPERQLAVSPDAEIDAFVEGFQRVRALLDGAPAARRPVVFVDPLEALFPLEDPLAEDAHRAEGDRTMLEALLKLADAGELSLVLLSRHVGCSSTRSIPGQEISLPDATDELVLGLLDEESCQTALDRLLHDLGVLVEDDALALLAEAAGGHPVVMWSIVDEVARRRSRSKLDTLDEARVEQVLEQVLARSRFQRFAAALRSDFEAQAQAAMRVLAGAEGGMQDAAGIAAGMTEIGGDATATEAVLDDLSRSTLVTPHRSEGYRLRIGLFRRFLADPPPFP